MTSDYAIVNVQRVNGRKQTPISLCAFVLLLHFEGDGWDQNLQLTWLAFVPDNSESDPSLSSVHQTYPRYIAGRTNVAPSPSSPIVTLTINHPEFWQWPLILVSVKSTSAFDFIDLQLIISSMQHRRTIRGAPLFDLFRTKTHSYLTCISPPVTDGRRMWK